MQRTYVSSLFFHDQNFSLCHHVSTWLTLKRSDAVSLSNLDSASTTNTTTQKILLLSHIAKSSTIYHYECVYVSHLQAQMRERKSFPSVRLFLCWRDLPRRAATSFSLCPVLQKKIRKALRGGWMHVQYTNALQPRSVCGCVLLN